MMLKSPEDFLTAARRINYNIVETDYALLAIEHR